MTVTEIFKRAGAACAPEVTISTTVPANGTALEWLDDGIRDLGMSVGQERMIKISANVLEMIPLPADLASILEIRRHDSNSPYRGRYDVRSGRIRFPMDADFDVYYRRLPGPILHLSDDLTSWTPTDPTGLALDDMCDWANAWKAGFNTHIASTEFHLAADSTNTITADDATDLVTLIALLTQAKAKFNAHRVLAGKHCFTDTRNVASVDTPNTLETCGALAYDLYDRFSLHLPSGLPDEVYHPALALYVAYRRTAWNNPKDDDLPRLDRERQRLKSEAIGNKVSAGFRVRQRW